MPNSPHPLASVIAARLPADCPEQVLLEAQRKFVRPLLEVNLKDALAEQRKVEERRLPRREADERVGFANGYIERLPTVGFRTMLDWIAKLCPPEINARDAFLALTYDARRAWAKEMVYEIGAASPGWDAIAADMQDALAAEVAEAWMDGLMKRNLVYAFAADQERMVKRMNQAALYKWLTDPEREDWEIKRYCPRLTGAYAKKIQAQFSEEQWRDITMAFGPGTGDPGVDERIASAQRQGFIG